MVKNSFSKNFNGFGREKFLGDFVFIFGGNIKFLDLCYKIKVSF